MEVKSLYIVKHSCSFGTQHINRLHINLHRLTKEGSSFTTGCKKGPHKTNWIHLLSKAFRWGVRASKYLYPTY